MNEVPADWYANERFWEAAYPFLFPTEVLDAAPVQVERLLQILGTERPCVLDLCCGPGRHSVPLAQRGCRVTGVDRSPYLLSRARLRADEAQADVEWIECDMRHFRRPGSFDLALSMFTSFGYFDDDAENRAVLRNVCDSLRPGGIFVIDVGGKESLARRFEPTGAYEVPGVGWLVQKRAISDDWCRIVCQWVMVRDGSVFEHSFRHWLYSGRELKEMLLAAGFAEVTLHADLTGAEYGPGANRLVAVARRSAREPAAGAT